MKNFFVFLMAIFFSSSALANEELRPTSQKCQVVFVFEQIGVFQSDRDARIFCNDLFDNFGINRGCFVRQFNDGGYEGNYRFRGSFSGNNFKDVFNRYFQFLNQRRFYNQRFTHTSRFFNCVD